MNDATNFLLLFLSLPLLSLSLCHLFDARTLAGQIVLVYPSIVFLLLSVTVVARCRRRRRVKTKKH